MLNWLAWRGDWRCCDRRGIERADEHQFWLHLLFSSVECIVILHGKNHTSGRLVRNLEVLCFHSPKVLFNLLAQRLVVSDLKKLVVFLFVFDVDFDIFIHLGLDCE